MVARLQHRQKQYFAIGSGIDQMKRVSIYLFKRSKARHFKSFYSNSKSTTTHKIKLIDRSVRAQGHAFALHVHHHRALAHTKAAPQNQSLTKAHFIITQGQCLQVLEVAQKEMPAVIIKTFFVGTFKELFTCIFLNSDSITQFIAVGIAKARKQPERLT